MVVNVLCMTHPTSGGQSDGDYSDKVFDHRAAMVEQMATWSLTKDRVVITASGVALTVSLAFYGEPKTALPNVQWPVTLGWALFALAVIAVVVTFELNRIELRRTIVNIDVWNEKGAPPGTKAESGILYFRSKSKKWPVLDAVNAVSVYLFIVGLALTVIGVWLNL